MESSTLKSSLTELSNSTYNMDLKIYIEDFLNTKDMTNFYELKYVAHMLQLAENLTDIEAIIDTLKWSVPTGEAINQIISNLTMVDHKYNTELHCKVLKYFEDRIVVDDPHHIRFPGDKDSFLQVQTSTVGMTGVRSFTVCLWAKISLDCSSKGFLLFRCASQKGGIDAVLSDRQESGQWSITLRSFTDSGKTSRKSEIHGRIYFTLGEWHHFTMKHEESNKLSFHVDGSMELENETPYQFSNAAQYKWTFGLGLKGGISNICFFSDTLSQTAIQVLYGLGPHTRSFATSVASVPQSSFDTGHVVLGSKVSKGSIAYKLCRLPILFNITASHIINGANLPQFPSGKLNTDSIEMIPWMSANNNFKAPTITGGCRLSLPCSWVSAWLDAGSVSVLLYIIGYYCKMINQDTQYQVTNGGININDINVPSSYLICLKQTLSLLQRLIKTSSDTKEYFIQIHGFHLLSHHLSQLYTKQLHIDMDIVILCSELLPALGIDSRSGDGVAATLQGLLFDFRIWGETMMEVKMHHMFKLVELMADKGEELEKSIGVQRILDILRLYVLRQDVHETTMTIEQKNEYEALHVACAEAGYSLLAISADAALNVYSRSGNSTYLINDIESLVSCLEETNSCLLAERILRIMYKFKENVPDILSDVLQTQRFAETTAVALLSKKGFSAEVYRETISLMLWGLIKESSVDSNALMTLRKTLIIPISAAEVFVSGRRKSLRSRPMSAADAKRLTEGNEQIKLMLKHAHKSWNIISVISMLIARAINEGYWNTCVQFSNVSFINNRNNMNFMMTVPSISSSTAAAVNNTNNNTNNANNTGTSNLTGTNTTSAGTNATSSSTTTNIHTTNSNEDNEENIYRMKVINEILSNFYNNGPFAGRPDFWMVLPFLPSLLSHCDLKIYQQVLMSFIVSLKTDEGQVETICNLPDRGWTKILIDLAAIGENYSYQANKKLNEQQHLLNAINGSNPDNNTHEIMEGNTLEVQLSHNESIAITCTELALDASAIMLEHKIRYHDQDSWSCWNCLLNCIKSSCNIFREKGKYIETQLIKRCLSLVFQRLARSNEIWNIGMLNFLVNILQMILNKSWCGEDDSFTLLAKKESTTQLTTTGTNTVDSTSNPMEIHSQILNTPPRPRIMQSIEEQQLLLFIVDIISCLRRAANRYNMYGRELNAMKIAMNIILGCLAICNEPTAEKLANEIVNNVAHLSKASAITMSADDYQQYIIQLFIRIETVIKDSQLDTLIKGRYEALIYRLCHHFGDLRIKSEIMANNASNSTFNRSSPVNEDDVPVYVLPLLDSLNGIENCHDVDSIFELFKLALVYNDTISFDTYETVEAMDAMIPPNQTTTAENELAVKSPGLVSSTSVLAIDHADYPVVQTNSAWTPENSGISGISSSDLVHCADRTFLDSPSQQVGLNLSPIRTDSITRYPLTPERMRASGLMNESAPTWSDVIHPESNKSDATTSSRSGIIQSIHPFHHDIDILNSSETSSATTIGQIEHHTYSRPEVLLHIETDLSTKLPPDESSISSLQTLLLPHSEKENHQEHVNMPTSTSALSTGTVPSLPQTPINSTIELICTIPDSQSLAWLKARYGMIIYRIDSERLRLSQSMQSLDLSVAAVDKHWNKIKRIVEFESFLTHSECQWKLGVAHEGAFPSRRRLVLKPRYDFIITHYKLSTDSDTNNADNNSNADNHTDGNNALINQDDGEQFKRALAKACAGYIHDIARMSNDLGPDPNEGVKNGPGGGSNPPPYSAIMPGDGWGVVGADGSDEGFGVIGLTTGREEYDPTGAYTTTGPTTTIGTNNSANTNNAAINALQDPGPGISITGTPAAAAGLSQGLAGGGPNNEGRSDSIDINNNNTTTTTNNNNKLPSMVDMNGDLKLVEEAMLQGRRIDTGPCHTGTRRIGHGPPAVTSKVILVTASGNYNGTLSLTTKDVYFISSFEYDETQHDDSTTMNLGHKLRIRRRRWTVSSISAIYLRRYRLRETAIEVFFRRGKHRHFFVDFGPSKEDMKNRNTFARTLMEAAPTSAFKQWPLMSPFRLVSEHRIQEKWIRGEISNFDYLMALNTISGRSYNDLCQYPVFPWVIADYTSPILDLNDPSIYRDLSKPMGALNEMRLQDFLDRYHSFTESESSMDNIPPFMYGSHYSTMVGVVLHFLIRLQPFASLHKSMQNGRFDIPDRLFSSIPITFLHNTTHLSEVKELTPEWFTTPEMFRNINNFDFGVTQDGTLINDVELPPWAKSPEDFVQINREALESEFVSAHLHEWIDLIFGYKQVGPAAVEAHNVFYYLTYAGSVDRQMIKDDALRKAIELQIAHFGQIPQQLFRTPHPARQVLINKPVTSHHPRPLKKNFMMSPTPISLPSPMNSVTNRYSATTGRSSLKDDIPVTITMLPSYGSAMTPLSPNMTREYNTNNNTAVYQFVPSQSDDEEVCAVAKCAFLTRRNPSLTLRRTSTAVTATNINPIRNMIPDMTGDIRPGPRLGITNMTTSLGVGNILSFHITTDRIVAVVDSGIIEVYKYMSSEYGKNIVSQVPALKAKAKKLHLMQSSPPQAHPPPPPTSSSALSQHSTDSHDMIIFDDSSSTNMPVYTSTIPSLSSSPHISTLDSRMQIMQQHRNSAASTTNITTTTSVHTNLDKTVGLPPEMIKESVISIEKDITHFEALPRIPLAACNLGNLMSESGTTLSSAGMGSPLSTLPSTVSQVEASAKLIHFSKSGNLLFSAGHVDGSVVVREIDSRTGFILSAGDFLGHRHRVISISSDFISGSCTDVLASCDAFGQILVWTVSMTQAPNGGKTYIISRRPQRMFKSKYCPYSSIDISWQMGIVTVSGHHQIRIFSIEREELLRTIDLTTLFVHELKLVNIPELAHILSETSDNLSYAQDKATKIDYIRSKEKELTSPKTLQSTSPSTVPSSKTDHTDIPIKSLDNNAKTASSHSEPAEFDRPSLFKNRESMNEIRNSFNTFQSLDDVCKQKQSSLIVQRIQLCNDGIIILHVQLKRMRKARSDTETSLDSSPTINGVFPNTSSTPVTIQDQDSGDAEDDTILKPLVISPEMVNSPPFIITEYLITMTISGYQTGRVVLPIACTFLNCIGRNDVVVAGFLDGKIALYASHDLTLLYQFSPYKDAHCVCATYPPALNISATPSAIVCVRVGPNENTPALLCASTTLGELFLKPLPDFIRWEKYRMPSALSQIVNAPLQAVRGTLQHATSLTAWTSEQAGALASNAKSFADETISEWAKTQKGKFLASVTSFFGGSKDDHIG